MDLSQELLDELVNMSSSLEDIYNDYSQHDIYREMRRNSSTVEFWHHLFGILGAVVSVFGILGNSISF